MTLRGAIALVCPTCGADLTGLDTDAIFGCEHCSTAWEPGEEGLSGPYPMVSADSPAPAESSVALPFWRLQVEPLLLPEKVSAIDFAYLPAFDMRKRSYFGEPGLTWTTERRGVPCKEPAKCLLGMTLRLDDARRLAWYYVLRTVDEDHDVSNLELDISFREPSVMLVDFVDADRNLTDPFTGKRYPSSAFPDVPNIRRNSCIDD